MRIIDRDSVKNPIDREKAEYYLNIAREDYSNSLEEVQKQYIPNLKDSIWRKKEVKEVLHNLFKNKCAFCETALVGGEDISHFWPKSIYWEKAYEWENIFLSCPTCNRSKAGRFPTIINNNKEEPNILNPCKDKIENDLLCSEDGKLIALTNKGANTIKIFGLNRMNLIRERFAAYQRVSNIMKKLTLLINWEDILNEFESLEILSDNSINNAFINDLINEMDETLPYFLARKSAYNTIKENTLNLMNDRILSQREYHSEVRSYDWIKELSIRNFKSIKDLDLVFNNESSNQFCMALIGENGMGKSSILQAIALLFMSKVERKELFSTASSVLRKDAIEGSIKLTFEKSPSTITLSFFKGLKDFEEDIKKKEYFPKINILGYSAIRLPAPNDSTIPPPNDQSITNLFNPNHYLPITESWLADVSRVNEKVFHKIATILKNILHLDNSSYFYRNKKQIYLKTNSSRILLEELSDGYKSLFSIITNIIYNWHNDIDGISNLQGIVLIDELEVHLHPKWKLKIISSLRKAFPNVNFIVTTHDPLCLRGLEDKEIIHLNKDKNDILKMNYLNIPPGLTTEQLLTGEWFNLDSTYDDYTIKLYEKYQSLLIKSKLEDKRINNRDIANLKDELSEVLNINLENSIERIAHSVAAEIMQEEHTLMMKKEYNLTKKQLRERIYTAAKERVSKG